MPAERGAPRPKFAELRIASGHPTQQALADAVNVDRSYITLLEQGLRDPSLEMIRRLAATLGVTVPQFVALLEDDAHEPSGSAA